MLRQLRTSTERARDLIDGVLVYARAGELSTEQVALGRLMAEVAEDLRPSLESAGATLEVGELPEVEVDPRQLRRVLQNLLGNAVKFRGEAPPRVEVTRPARQPRMGRDRARQRRSASTRTRRPGSSTCSRATTPDGRRGIGLAVCRRIVEAHGGRIWAEAPDGGGSAFRFTLPR